MSNLLFYQLMIIMIITFIILIFGLKMFFSKYLNKAVARLKKLQHENEAQAEKLAKEFEALKLKREAEVLKAQEKAKMIIDEANRKENIIYQEGKTRAEKEYQERLEESKKILEKVKQNLISNFHDQTINNATRIIKFLFSDKGKDALQHLLVLEIIEEIRGISRDKFLERIDRIRVYTPYNLDQEEKQKLIEVFSEKMDKSVQLEEIVDREIIGGLIINIRAMVIDGSLKKKMEKIKSSLEEDLKLNSITL
ncbi:MAG: F0F1 ATP synthase subunit delta [bacterium]